MPGLALEMPRYPIPDEDIPEHQYCFGDPPSIEPPRDPQVRYLPCSGDYYAILHEQFEYLLNHSCNEWCEDCQRASELKTVLMSPFYESCERVALGTGA